MGDYTGFHIKVLLKPSTPPEVIDILRYQTRQVDEFTGILPDHRLFQFDHWKAVLVTQAAYQLEYEQAQPPVEERLALFGDYWQLHTSSAPKYGRSINEFLDWIRPHVDPSEYGKMVGNHKTEYTRNKTHFSFDENKVTELKETIHKDEEYYST